MAGPLAGVRIIEMGQLIAIPWAMKMLADMGAQVIRFESCQRMEGYRGDSLYKNDIEGETWNRGANFYEHNRNKLGITLDLSKPQGLEIPYIRTTSKVKPGIGAPISTNTTGTSWESRWT
jgi:formyl-CoA transferase